MAVSILNLSDGGVSLEFDSRDAKAVREAIRKRYGPIRRRWHVMSADVSFGGELFVFQNEWSDPCLISRSTTGAEMLEQIAGDLGG
ncbi:MAG: hypothetical protein KKC29_08545 [Alphaproteobacteria bacterium]|nr:hypothetical protein [Alphaproteobacteria bacterium]MBU2042055.1 hypothetical protein [Alphaproteobacteria bacterium]MBU2126074.1 hypothetical protein [Alphaproteobacteria bacterium]MBU2209948.1 hypothetical protein [Alphaproteobacteria bacterium]MBU2291137.1 hypothetical protein [Alphaproteobacteria bacterium]